MLMPIEINIKFVLSKHGEIAINDMGVVNVPLTPEGMVLDTSLPHNTIIFVPYLHHLLNPGELIVSPFNHLWVSAD